MSKFDPRFLDASLAAIVDEATGLVLCSADPLLTWASVGLYGLANFDALSWGPAEDASPTGRKRPILPFTGGIWTATGTGTHFALIDANSNRVLLSGPVSPTVVGTVGQQWQMASAYYITLPGVA